MPDDFLSPGSRPMGRINQTEHDEFLLDVDAQRRVTISASSAANCERRLVLYLYGPNGQLLEEDTIDGGNQCPRIQRNLAPGRYTVWARGNNGVQINGYTITLAFD